MVICLYSASFPCGRGTCAAGSDRPSVPLTDALGDKQGFASSQALHPTPPQSRGGWFEPPNHLPPSIDLKDSTGRLFLPEYLFDASRSRQSLSLGRAPATEPLRPPGVSAPLCAARCTGGKVRALCSLPKAFFQRPCRHGATAECNPLGPPYTISHGVPMLVFDVLPPFCTSQYLRRQSSNHHVAKNFLFPL